MKLCVSHIFIDADQIGDSKWKVELKKIEKYSIRIVKWYLWKTETNRELLWATTIWLEIFSSNIISYETLCLINYYYYWLYFNICKVLCTSTSTWNRRYLNCCNLKKWNSMQASDQYVPMKWDEMYTRCMCMWQNISNWQRFFNKCLVQTELTAKNFYFSPSIDSTGFAFQIAIFPAINIMIDSTFLCHGISVV